MSAGDEVYDLTTSLLEDGDEYKGYVPEDYSRDLENLEAGYGSGSSFQTPNNYSPISTSSSDSFQTIKNNAEEDVQNFVEGNAQHHVIDISSNDDNVPSNDDNVPPNDDIVPPNEPNRASLEEQIGDYVQDNWLQNKPIWGQSLEEYLEEYMDIIFSESENDSLNLKIINHAHDAMCMIFFYFTTFLISKCPMSEYFFFHWAVFVQF